MLRNSSMSEPATSDVIHQTRKNKAKGAIALASIGAVACGVCCALPFAVPAVALAGSGGALAWLGGAQGVFSVVAVALVGLAWAWVGITSARSKRRPARATLVAMGAISLVLVAGLAVQLEQLLC